MRPSFIFLFVFCGLSFGYYEDFSYWGNKGIESANNGNFDDAIKYYTKAIEKWSYSDSYENKAGIYYNRGNAYHHKGEYDRAIEDYNEAIRLNPKDADAYYNRGYAYNLKKA